MQSEIIHIAYSLDDNYTEHTCVSMASVLHNTKSDIHFHIIEKTLSKHNKDKISEIHNKITFHKFNVKNENDFPLILHWTIETYFRMFLQDILNDLNKVIWLDSDTMVEGDILDIWNFDLNGKYVGAVNYTCFSGLHKKNLLEIGWYFNAAVMLFDLQSIRESNIFSQATAICLNLYKKITEANLNWSVDQDILNYLLGGMEYTAMLPPRANVMPFKQRYHFHLYTLEDSVRTITEPLVIHFSGKRHPSFFSRKYKDYEIQFIKRYYFYKAMTPFADKEKDAARIEKYEYMEKSAENTFINNEYEYINHNIVPTLNILADKLRSCLNGKKLVLWGAGNAIHIIIAQFVAKGIYPYLIVDGLAEKQESDIFNYRVQNPEILNGKSNEYFVVLAMMNEKPAKQVAEILKKYGYRENQYHHIFTFLWEKINEKW